VATGFGTVPCNDEATAYLLLLVGDLCAVGSGAGLHVLVVIGEGMPHRCGSDRDRPARRNQLEPGRPQGKPAVRERDRLDGAPRLHALDGTNTRLRLGVAHCTEFVHDVPSYTVVSNGSKASGFSNTVVSFKRQLPVPLGFDLSATAGVSLPSGSPKIVGQSCQPYLDSAWSHPIAEHWEVVGMFTVIWFPRDSIRNPTFEPTFSVEREFEWYADLFAEYVGDYNHQRPSQIVDGGGSWRITRTQQLDFHVGVGLNSSTVDHYFGLGYSFRLDHL
jgi:hypothetical protein